MKPLGACLLSFGALVVGAAGCSEGLETVPVSGKVTIAGRDRPKVCRLFFHPVETKSVTRPTAAETDEEGMYEVRSFKGVEGLVPGTYSVRVSYYDLKPGKDPADDRNWIQSDYDAGELVVDPDSDGVEHNINVPAKS